MTVVMPNCAYRRPWTLPDALRLWSENEDAAFVSGGHTLLPAMKAGLAAPSVLIDLSRIPEMQGLALNEGGLAIGAATTHAQVASSPVVRGSLPVLAALAGSIGDVQVRNRGTIGGSVANNDPAADYPAAILGLGATVVTDRRSIPADEYFAGFYATVLEPGEIVTRLVFPVPAQAGYAKFCNPASGYAMAAVFVARLADGSVRVAVTGSGRDGVFRWSGAETALSARFESDALADLLPDPDTMTGDLHGSPAYRANLTRVMARRAVRNLGRASVYR